MFELLVQIEEVALVLERGGSTTRRGFVFVTFKEFSSVDECTKKSFHSINDVQVHVPTCSYACVYMYVVVVVQVEVKRATPREDDGYGGGRGRGRGRGMRGGGGRGGWQPYGTASYGGYGGDGYGGGGNDTTPLLC